MASSVPARIAEAIQTAHIKRHPSPQHDLGRSATAAAFREEPVRLEDVDMVESDVGEDEDEDEDIPLSVLRPKPRSHPLPPMPDLRFEQSYLRSIAAADTWWRVAWITARDQVSCG